MPYVYIFMAGFMLGAVALLIGIIIAERHQ
ncbi:hypothetical protein SUSUWATARI_00350 [Serratia phage vB_SmaM-Susuwatari]|nr:hypothetical protein SUSUWATARI_00350 [Serratia phage vB_SmaM-Susuwatari]